MANLADDDLLLVQRTSAGISTNYSITGSALKEDLTGVTGLIANPVEVLTPLDGSGLSGDISYYPETSTITAVDFVPSGGTAAAPEDNSWYEIAYGDGKYVAISYSGTNRVMYSSDGKNWSSASAPENNSWYSITYGDDKFVAVGASGTYRVMYSSDGISWTSAQAAQSNSWRSITYGNGKFVAVSSNGNNQVMWSTTGTGWGNGYQAENNDWYGVAFGDGVFVAVATNGMNRVMTSSDGINWSSKTAASQETWKDIAYGNGKFVAVADSGSNRAMWSSDSGNSWNTVVPETSNWRSVTYGNGKFVAVGDYGTNRIMWADETDLDTWYPVAAPEQNSWEAVHYANGKFVAVASTGTNRIMYSGNGINWSTGESTTLTLTNDKVFDSSNGTEMSTVDQVLTSGTVVEGPAGADVAAFSTTLYAGDSVMNRPITTGIDNTGDSLIWVKNRNTSGYVHVLSGQHLLDGGFTNSNSQSITNIWTNSSAMGDSATNYITGVLDNGFTIGNSGHVNDPGQNYVAWNFRELPGFLDIVTFSGNSQSGRALPHNLGTAPGFIMLKNLTLNENWMCYHKDAGLDGYLAAHERFLQINYDTIPFPPSGSPSSAWGNTAPNENNFYLGASVNSNSSGSDFVAYLFADVPGRIKCGTYTGSGGIQSVDAGFTGGCAWVMVKNISNAGDWSISDSERISGNGHLYPNNHDWEDSSASFHVNDNGFNLNGSNVNWNQYGDKYIYVAIASNAMAPEPGPTGTLTADADASTPSISLTDVTGTWINGTTAVGRTQLTEYAPGPDDITFTSQNAGTTPFNGTDATLAFRRWTLESRASAGDPWTVVDTYEDYDITASQDGATPWSSNKPTLSPNTMYRVKVAYISTNADPVESVYNTFTTGSN